MSVSKEEFYSSLTDPLDETTIKIKGREYRLREMTEADRCQYEITLSSGGKWDIEKARRAMITYMLVDNDGNRIVDKEADLVGMKGSVAGLLYDECLSLNAYKNGEVEDLIKNSEPVAG